MRKKKFGIIRKRILSLLLAAMMVSSSAVTVFATDDISFSDDTSTEITEQTPDETDVTEETPDETDVTEETPDETDVTEEIPDETDVTEETPDETDAPEETPDETDVTEETPDETDVTEELPVEEPSEDGILVEHFVSDVEGEGLLPYEYYVMEYTGAMADDDGSTSANTSLYYSSYSSSKSEYSSMVGYNSLTSVQKEAYDILYDIACTIDESAVYDAEYMEKYDQYYFPQMSCAIPLEDIDSNSLFKVYVALKNDNPQFFWMGHGYVSWTSSTHIAAFQFGIDDGSLDYADGNDRMQAKAELFEEVEAVLEEAEAYGNDYSKEWYIHNYICEKTVYIESDHAHDISGVLLDGEAVCESYAKTFQLFMNALDIDVMYITGIGNGGGHAWNQIGLENADGVTEWYNVDVTWDDDKNGYGFYYFNVIDSDGTIYDFTNGFVSNGKQVNEHTPKTSGDREYVYPAKKCTSTTFAYKNHSKNFKLASTEPVAIVNGTEYMTLKDAVEATTEGDTVILLSDASYNGFDMPSHHIIIDCAGYTINLDKAMDMNADLTIKNVGGKTIDELGGAYKITNADFEYIYINDNTLSFEGTWSDYLPVFISGYDNNGNEAGTLSIDLEDGNRCGILEAVGMAEFVIADNEYVDTAYEFTAVEVVIGENSVLSTAYGCGEIVDLTVSDTSWLCVSTDDENPFFIIYGEITGDVLNVKAANMEEGLATVVTREKYPVEKFNFVYITDEGEEDYYVTRISSEAGHYLYGPFPTADFIVSDGENSVRRCTFGEAVEYIEEQNSSSTKYTITYEGEEETVTIESDMNFESGFIEFRGAEFRFEGNVSGDAIIEFFDGAEFVGNSVKGNNSNLKIFGVNKSITFENGEISNVHIESRESADVIFDGSDVSESDILIMSADLQILDSKKRRPDVHFESIGIVAGEVSVSFDGINTIYVDKLETSHAGDIINFNSGKVEIKDIVVNSGVVFNIKSGDILSVTGQITRDKDSSYIYVESETVENGQKIMNISSDYSEIFRTEQVNSEGNPIEVVYRDNTLVYDVPVYRLEGIGIFSEWNDILAYINNNGTSETAYEVTLLCNAEIEKLALPAATKAKSVTFSGEYILTLGNTTLSVPIDTYFECDVVAENAAITVSAGKMLSVNAGTVKSITGTKTSALSAGTLYAVNVKTFDTVDTTEEIYIEGDMTGINNFSGDLKLSDSGSNVNITNIASDSVFSYNTGDELPDVTVNGISEEATLTINVNNGASLAGGTVILKSSSDIADEDYEGGSIVIENKGLNGEELGPYFYSSSKVIKAECPDAMTLSYDDKVKNLPNIDKAFEIINANKDKTVDYTITFNTPVTFDKLSIPTYANSITFAGEDMTYKGTTLKLTIDTYFGCRLIAENTAITASKNVGFYDATVKSVTGTKTSVLSAGTLSADSVKTFAGASGIINVGSDMTVTDFEGLITAKTPEAEISIERVVGLSELMLTSDENGKFGEATVKDIAEESTLTVSVIDENGNNTAIANGTVILYTSGEDLSDKVSVLNRTPDEKPLTPFYYPKTKTIKAEWAEAITLSYNDVEENLPNIDRVFEVITANDNNAIDYTIRFNAPVTYDKLTIPSDANSIAFIGEAMTFTGKTLKFPVNTTLECSFNAENASVTASKNITVSNAVINSLAGTKNSVLTITDSLDTQALKTFADVNSEGRLYADGTMSGITNFGGALRLTNPKASATITNLEAESYVELITDESGKLPKLTINGVSDEAVRAVITLLNENGGLLATEGGTVVMYSSKDISENIIIENETSDEKPLTAFYYKSNKSIKAEWKDTITLSYNDTITNLPNVDKVFEIINANKDKTVDYEIIFNTPVEFEKLTIPSYANSITFAGEDMVFTGKTLKFPVNTTLECELIAENTAVTASKDLLISDATVKTLTGASKSNLTAEGTLSAETVKTFATIDATAGNIIADTSVTVTEFKGNMTAEPEATVTIKTIPDDAVFVDIRLVSDENGKFGKLNLTNVNKAINVSVIDEEGEVVSLMSNTPVLYSSSDISSNITVLNETSNENPLSAYYVKDKKAVYAGYEDAVEARYVDANEELQTKFFTNLEEALAFISSDSLYARINLDSDVRVENLSFPKYANGVDFNGNGNTVMLDNIASVSALSRVYLYDVVIDSTVPFKITASDYMSFSGFSSSTLTAVSGKSAKSIRYLGINNANYDISGFGSLEITEDSEVALSGKVTVKNVVYGNNSVLNVLPGATIKFTNVSPFYEDGNPLSMIYHYGASPVTISGTVNGEVILKHQNKFTSGEQLLVASKADLSKFTLYENSLPDEKEYVLTRKSGGKVYIKPIVLMVSDGTDNYKYAEWSDFTAMVNADKTPEVYYTVTLLGDYNADGAITMPKAGYYSSIILASEDKTPDTITFTGGIKQTGDMTIENIGFCSVNSKGVAATYTFSAGKYSLTATDVDFGKGSVTGATDSVISLVNCQIDGKLTAANAVLSDTTITGAVKTTKMLTLNSDMTFMNTLNVYGFATTGDDFSITLTKGKLLTVGKGGSGEDTITINLDVPITAKTKVGTIAKDCYNGNFVGGNVDIAVEGTTIYAYPKA